MSSLESFVYLCGVPGLAVENRGTFYLGCLSVSSLKCICLFVLNWGDLFICVEFSRCPVDRTA